MRYVIDDFVDVTDEVRDVTVSAYIPPIPLWKVGLILLAIIGGGAGGYYALKGGER